MIQLPQATLMLRRVYIQDANELETEIQEGEAPMSQEQQDYYKNIIGDGQGRISVGRDMSEMDYGSGGKVFVSVSLVCDQSAGGLSSAINLAAQMADSFIVYHHQQMKERCIQIGLLKPVPTNGRPQQY